MPIDIVARQGTAICPFSGREAEVLRSWLINIAELWRSGAGLSNARPGRCRDILQVVVEVLRRARRRDKGVDSVKEEGVGNLEDDIHGVRMCADALLCAVSLED